MRLKVQILVVAAALALPASAAAEYYLSKQTAQTYTRHFVHTSHSELHGVNTACRPKNHQHADTVNYSWHKWTCLWVARNVDNNQCSGIVVITGSPRGPGWYRYSPIIGKRCSE